MLIHAYQPTYRHISEECNYVVSSLVIALCIDVESTA